MPSSQAKRHLRAVGRRAARHVSLAQLQVGGFKVSRCPIRMRFGKAHPGPCARFQEDHAPRFSMAAAGQYLDTCQPPCADGQKEVSTTGNSSADTCPWQARCLRGRPAASPRDRPGQSRAESAAHDRGRSCEEPNDTVPPSVGAGSIPRRSKPTRRRSVPHQVCQLQYPTQSPLRGPLHKGSGIDERLVVASRHSSQSPPSPARLRTGTLSRQE